MAKPSEKEIVLGRTSHSWRNHRALRVRLVCERQSLNSTPCCAGLQLTFRPSRKARMSCGLRITSITFAWRWRGPEFRPRYQGLFCRAQLLAGTSHRTVR